MMVRIPQLNKKLDGTTQQVDMVGKVSLSSPVPRMPSLALLAPPPALVRSLLTCSSDTLQYYSPPRAMEPVLRRASTMSSSTRIRRSVSQSTPLAMEAVLQKATTMSSSRGRGWGAQITMPFERCGKIEKTTWSGGKQLGEGKTDTAVVWRNPH
jgi:hypothetical protein